MGKSGKLKDLERIIDAYQDGLFRFAFFRIGSLADAQDIVQTVFLKMCDSKIDLTKVDNLKSYLYRSIANSCMNHLRRRRSANHISLESVVLKADDDDNVEILKEYERIRKLMESIPHEQAEIIQMRTIDGLAFTEIAEIAELPVTTVKSRFKYGIDKLKSKIITQED